jgi:acyl-CoA reductase-like NAD-dependent aldehyde dehydrogenase
VVASYPNCGIEETREALGVARRVFDETPWPTCPARERAQILTRASTLLTERADEFARWVALEAGKPIRMARSEVIHSAQVMSHFAAATQDLKGEAITQQVPDGIGLVIHEPIGVVGVITPWNFPLSLLVRKVAAAIAAGCTVVAKPSHYTPAVALMLADLLTEAGLPAGVFNVLTSDIDNGALVGQELASSTLVDMVAFTGSTEAGKSVGRAAMSNVKRIALELGGKSPNVVFADANMDDAVKGAYNGIYLNSGQVCQAGTRLLVERSVKDEFVRRLMEMSENAVLGDPLLASTTMGPLINERQVGRVTGYIEQGRKEAKVIYEATEKTKGQPEGSLFVAPTIFDDVPSAAVIAQEEVFGPVLAVLAFDTVEESIKLANETMYGLAAAVWTSNINTAFAVTKGIRAGTVWVNAYHSSSLNNLPYGGYKQSGLGRELGTQGLDEYLETKSVQIQLPRVRR